MANDLQRLKEKLWKQFDIASTIGESLDKHTAEIRAANRAAAGTIGLALVSLEREERERVQETKAFQLVGKP